MRDDAGRVSLGLRLEEMLPTSRMRRCAAVAPPYAHLSRAVSARRAHTGARRAPALGGCSIGGVGWFGSGVRTLARLMLNITVQAR